MSIWSYRYAGLTIASEFELPEWRPFRHDMGVGDSDVRIIIDGEIIAAPLPAIDPSEFRFTIPNVCTYRVRCGREIALAPAQGADALAIRLFLLGTAWGVLCYQRGQLAIHASVVQSGEHAVAFSGHAGSGKSTLAAALIDRGYRLVGDDLCCVELSDMPGIHRGAPRLKLWDDALCRLEWDNVTRQRDLHRIDKFHLELDTSRCAQDTDPVSLGAIYLLAWGDSRLERLYGLNAVRQLISYATYRPELVEPMGQLGGHWQRCAFLAQQVPIWRLTRPRDQAVSKTLSSLPFKQQVSTLGASDGR